MLMNSSVPNNVAIISSKRGFLIQLRAPGCRTIVFPDYMQDNVVIVAVVLVGMFVPVRSFDVQFNRARPCSIVDPDLSISKIRSLVGVELTGQ